MVTPPVVDDRGSEVARLVVRSVARCYDWSYDRSFGATIDRTTGRRSQRSVARCYDWSCDWSLHPTIDLRSTVGCHNWSWTRSRHECSHDRSQDATIDTTIGRRSPRLIVRSVVRRNNWSYIGGWSLPLVARFPTMALAIDIFVSLVIARPRVDINRRMRPLLEIVANIADRSHLGPIVRSRNRTIRCDCGFSR